MARVGIITNDVYIIAFKDVHFTLGIMKATIWSFCKWSKSYLLIVRSAFLYCALALVVSTAFSQTVLQPVGIHSAVNAQPQESKQDQSVPRLDTSSLEKTIRDAVHEVKEQRDPNADEKLQSDRKIVGYTSQLAADTHRLAEFTFWLSVATSLMAAIVFGQLCMFWRQLGQMKADSKNTEVAAEAAKKNADASLIALRPWLSCKVKIAGPLTFNDAGDAVFRFECIVENVGKTPAMSVDLFFPQLTLMAPGVEHSILKLQNLANHSRGMGVPKMKSSTPAETPVGFITNPHGRVLFPSELHTENLQLKIPNSQLIESCKDISPSTNFWPELIVLVSYVYNLAEARADTGFVFSIQRNGIPPFQIGESVSAEELHIEPHRLWGGFAT